MGGVDKVPGVAECGYDTDAYLAELRRYRALAALRMYEGLLETLAGRAEECRASVEAAGTDAETWRSLPGGERQAIVTPGARRLKDGNAGP
jgi:acyl-CoA reductase-like NAD-dependent aldehyde dehydrogenase